MLKLDRVAALLIGAASMALSALPAIAATPPDVFRDANNNVYVIGSTATTLANDPNARIQRDEPLVRRIRAGYCGEVRIATSSSLPDVGASWTINGATRSGAGLTAITDSDLVPRCRGNAFIPTAPSGGFRDSTSSTTRYYLTGFSPGTSYEVSFNDIDASQAANPNQCNFFRISNTQANPLPARLTIGSTEYTVASLPMADPPLCQRSAAGTGYVRYNPSTW